MVLTAAATAPPMRVDGRRDAARLVPPGSGLELAALLGSALGSLLRNKLRSSLTIFGITIGIAAVICVVAIGKAGQARVEQQLRNLGDNFVWIEAGGRAVNGVSTGPRGTNTLRLGDAIAIRNEIPLIKAVSPNVDASIQVIYGNQNWSSIASGAALDADGGQASGDDRPARPPRAAPPSTRSRPPDILRLGGAIGGSTMDKIKPLFTASATATGGRNGHTEATDGSVKADLSVPKEMGGPGKPGTITPEHLFAAGYAACFGGALDVAAKRQKKDASKARITCSVSIGPREGGGYGLAVKLRVEDESLPPAELAALAKEAHEKICPYSHATRGNVDVELSVAGA